MSCDCSGGTDRKRECAPKFEDFCRRSGIHGFAEIYFSLTNRNCALLVFWALVIIAGCLFAVSGCYAIVMQYFTSPVIVSYVIRRAQEKIRLPDIVVCPFTVEIRKKNPKTRIKKFKTLVLAFGVEQKKSGSFFFNLQFLQ